MCCRTSRRVDCSSISLPPYKYAKNQTTDDSVLRKMLMFRIKLTLKFDITHKKCFENNNSL